MAEDYRVLVVDDDVILCSVFKDALMSSGFGCETAYNGQAALGLLNASSFHVMVTDVVMPGMDGFELTKKAKQVAPEMAVIVMSGFQQEESYHNASSAGASDFLKKPFGIPELIARVDRAIKVSGVLTQIRQKQEEVRDVAREMIAGLQDEATRRIAELEAEIISLRKKIS